jgi:hypothetical protein
VTEDDDGAPRRHRSAVADPPFDAPSAPRPIEGGLGRPDIAVTIKSRFRRVTTPSHTLRPTLPSKGAEMIILGLILLIIGYVAGISLLYYIGGILLIVGVVLLVLGRSGRAVGGRAHWY